MLENLLDTLFLIPYILYLPYIALGLLISTLPFLTIKSQRVELTAYLLTSLLIHFIIIGTLGPGMNVTFTLILLMVLLIFPIIVLTQSIFKRQKQYILLWLYISLVGLMQSVSWFVWIGALANS